MLFFLFKDVLLAIDNYYFTFLLLVFCLFNILVGTIVGADQDTFKRFIANSSIQFHGFAILLLVLLKGDIFLIFTNYFIAYLLGYFALLFFLNALQNVDQNKNDLNFLNEHSFNLNSLNVSFSFRFYLFILLVSLSGIPLTFLFLSKSLLFILTLEDFISIFIIFFLSFFTIFLLNFYISFFVNFLLGLKERYITTFIPLTLKLLFILSNIFVILGIITIFFVFDFLFLYITPFDTIKHVIPFEYIKSFNFF